MPPPGGPSLTCFHVKCHSIEIDLAAIARSSVAVSGSPPKDNVSIFVSQTSRATALLVTRRDLTFAPCPIVTYPQSIPSQIKTQSLHFLLSLNKTKTISL
jgi:hypothetical protein